MDIERFKRLQSQLTGTLKSRYGSSNGNDIQDAVQEALIQLWKDLSSSKQYDDRYLFNRAHKKAWAFLFSDTTYATGHMKMSTEGLRHSGTTDVNSHERRDAIAKFLKENTDRRYTNVEISNATGIPTKSVGHHRKVLETSGHIVQTKDDTNHLDKRAYIMQTLYYRVAEGYTDFLPQVNAVAQEEDFTDRLVSDDYVMYLIRNLPKRFQGTAYHLLVLDERQRDAVEKLGISQGEITRRFREVRKLLKAAYEV